MDRYDANNDHYCIPGTDVLANLLGITRYEDLELAEREITAATIFHIAYCPPPYDLAYMQQLHRVIFQPIYPWAGQLRTVDISKMGTPFCTNSRIDAESTKLFAQLAKENWLAGLDRKTFAGRLAHFYCEINMIHPFREGNGRVQRLLFEQLAMANGYVLSWDSLSAHDWIEANIEGVHSHPAKLQAIFEERLV